ncbi:MAG: 16S rRNA (cytosine(1402)-N(4))-methyltransferase RsmH [Candidatus Endonucleobacter bathymodioli]|uniref:Ribosomal RNA small subunit methyltransferase H n=1 Tax=Candidatus Endonucleibacter bathymodioli TaxID=539814 RepID=A0AA90NTK6_9GAMM|nr:16S rRNA (cytosine(1402)-N(4))-methyltransferase RsmH [Candidatus Endonucleobacter bathymodioli]
MDEFGQHKTVLCVEAVEALLTNFDGVYIDGTFGRGGHSKAILDQLSSIGRLLGIDKDPEAVAVGKNLMASDDRFHIYHSSFSKLNELQEEKSVDGILLDLGVSSPQLDCPERGFSFSKDGSLDMRMNYTTGESAASWLARAEESEISRVLWEYGEERFSRRMAKAIVREREIEPIETTGRLAAIIAAGYPRKGSKRSKGKGKHPATRAFQAIRIHINRELDELSDCLDKALELLKPGGRLVVISFHSLEDRIAKRFIRMHEKGDPLPSWLPVREDQLNKRLKALGKAIKPSDAEVRANPRARSAIMRVAEKLV